MLDFMDNGKLSGSYTLKITPIKAHAGQLRQQSPPAL
jgi:hypothetical protein